jgi:hypothetical protein
MDSISDGRLDKYKVVAEYLISRPEQSALTIREKYRTAAAPAGAKKFPEIML